MKIKEMDEEQKVALLGALFGGLATVIGTEIALQSARAVKDIVDPGSGIGLTTSDYVALGLASNPVTGIPTLPFLAGYGIYRATGGKGL
jgi:hypothetical protein